MHCPHCKDLVYTRRVTGSNIHRKHTASSAALSSAADGSCTSCRFIFDGTSAVLGPKKFDRVEIDQLVTQKDGEERHTYPLVVHVVGPKNIVEVDFYTDSPRVHNEWPLIPVSPHRSADSSSEQCLQQAKEWLQHCLVSHTGCAPSLNLNPPEFKLPSRVIAVGNELQQPYLHETQVNEMGMYVALSYCWGMARTFTTTQSTLQDRKRGFAVIDLPRTCQDAVIVARALGMSYIWIDSLCIIQDSKADWEREAAMMCDVYSNATVTLAGLDSSDSDTGLFISYPTRQTYNLSCVLSNGDSGYVYARKSYRNLLMGFLHADRRPPAGDDFGGILQTRGWTLQELILSPRILWFSAWELGWSCRTETACECDPIPTSQLLKRGAGRLTTLPQEGDQSSS